MKILWNSFCVFVCLCRVFPRNQSLELSDFLWAIRVASKLKVGGFWLYDLSCLICISEWMHTLCSCLNVKDLFAQKKNLIFWKNVLGFLIFCMKLQWHRYLKLRQIIFFGEKHCFEDLGPKATTVGPKWGFSVIINSQFLKLFLFFARRYSSIKA